MSCSSVKFVLKTNAKGVFCVLAFFVSQAKEISSRLLKRKVFEKDSLKPYVYFDSDYNINVDQTS